MGEDWEEILSLCCRTLAHPFRSQDAFRRVKVRVKLRVARLDRLREGDDIFASQTFDRNVIKDNLWV